MRLWTLHPKYLDRQGLLAVWREGLLAQAVLQGNTKGYKNHPQLERFKTHPNPLEAIGYYLRQVYAEARKRGYSFNASKIGADKIPQAIRVTSGQIAFEKQHLRGKLKKRSQTDFEHLVGELKLDPHPLFLIVEGEIENWERGI
ncbi:MAG: pyrimidine dimer DNA glycosylase/endonuclease V [Anaerolineales bacterium]|jgi:hypothetical protein